MILAKRLCYAQNMSVTRRMSQKHSNSRKGIETLIRFISSTRFSHVRNTPIPERELKHPKALRLFDQSVGAVRNTPIPERELKRYLSQYIVFLLLIFSQKHSNSRKGIETLLLNSCYTLRITSQKHSNSRKGIETRTPLSPHRGVSSGWSETLQFPKGN